MARLRLLPRDSFRHSVIAASGDFGLALEIPLALEGEACGELVAAGFVVELDDIDCVIGIVELNAHAAGELVAGDQGMDRVAFRRAGHRAARIVDALVPRAFDLAAPVGDL